MSNQINRTIGPTYRSLEDEGCEMWPSCLGDNKHKKCPWSECFEDYMGEDATKEGGLTTWLEKNRGDEIMDMLFRGHMSGAAVAQAFNVSIATIYRIKRMRSTSREINLSKSTS